MWKTVGCAAVTGGAEGAAGCRRAPERTEPIENRRKSCRDMTGRPGPSVASDAWLDPGSAPRRPPVFWARPASPASHEQRSRRAARRPATGLIHHTDRGCQYTAGDYAALLTRHGIAQSLGRPGTCWDNAVAESFFATLKVELVDRHIWPTRRQAQTAIFEFIESFYNRQRRHSTLGYLPPAAFEAEYHAAESAA